MAGTDAKYMKENLLRELVRKNKEFFKNKFEGSGDEYRKKIHELMVQEIPGYGEDNEKEDADMEFLEGIADMSPEDIDKYADASKSDDNDKNKDASVTILKVEGDPIGDILDRKGDRLTREMEKAKEKEDEDADYTDDENKKWAKKFMKKLESNDWFDQFKKKEHNDLAM